MSKTSKRKSIRQGIKEGSGLAILEDFYRRLTPKQKKEFDERTKAAEPQVKEEKADE